MIMTFGDKQGQRRVLSYFSLQVFCKICNKCVKIKEVEDLSILTNHLEKYHQDYLEPNENNLLLNVNKDEETVTKLEDLDLNIKQQYKEDIHLTNIPPTVIRFTNKDFEESSQEDNINNECYQSDSGGDSENDYNDKSSKKIRHSCQDCGTTYVCPQKLKAHIKMKHLNVLRFFCPEESCKKGFFYKKKLTEHQRIHTGDKPFLCTICGDSFRLKGTLQNHIKSHGEKQFKCASCNKGFSTRGMLKQHELIHSGDRAFVCQECGKRFTQRSQLTNHTRLHTGETPFSCLKCGKKFKMKHHLTHYHKCKRKDESI